MHTSDTYTYIYIHIERDVCNILVSIHIALVVAAVEVGCMKGHGAPHVAEVAFFLQLCGHQEPTQTQKAKDECQAELSLGSRV